MKVYIGPYPTNWLICRIHTRHMKKKYGYDWPVEQTKYEKFLEKLEDVVQSVYNVTINKLIRHRERKIKVRIDRYDTWSMDNTLAHIIVPMLKQLRETKMGAPLVEDKDVPKELRSSSASPKEHEHDIDNNHFKRWDYVLDEMIFAFESQLSDWEEQFESGEHDHQWKEIEVNGKKMYQMQKGPNDTFKVDRKAKDEYYKRIRNGYRLFGKYYESLWD